MTRMHVQNMIPGLGSDILGKAGEEESAKRIKRCIVMMDSMCDAGEAATGS